MSFPVVFAFVLTLMAIGHPSLFPPASYAFITRSELAEARRKSFMINVSSTGLIRASRSFIITFFTSLLRIFPDTMTVAVGTVAPSVGLVSSIYFHIFPSIIVLPLNITDPERNSQEFVFTELSDLLNIFAPSCAMKIPI